MKPGEISGESLIEQAMGAVSIVACPMCGGAGKLKKGLEVTCPRCNGSGKTTSSGTPLSKWDDHEQ